MSTQYSILVAVASKISGLGLSNLQEVAVRASAKDGDNWYDGITVHPVAEDEFAGTNACDDIGYGAQVTMVVNNDEDPSEDDLYGTWRQTIRKAFIHQRLAGISTVHTCLVQPGPIYRNVPENLDVGSLIIRVISRETRG
jgi:hypothetical protein